MMGALGAAPAWFPWSRAPQRFETEACHSSPHRWNAPLIMTQAIVECTSDSQRRRGWGEKGGVKVQTKGSPSVIKFVEGQKELQSLSSGHVEGEKRGHRTSFFVSEHKFLQRGTSTLRLHNTSLLLLRSCSSSASSRTFPPWSSGKFSLYPAVIWSSFYQVCCSLRGNAPS